jgi:hypothetical protein
VAANNKWMDNIQTNKNQQQQLNGAKMAAAKGLLLLGKREEMGGHGQAFGSTKLRQQRGREENAKAKGQPNLGGEISRKNWAKR